MSVLKRYNVAIDMFIKNYKHYYDNLSPKIKGWLDDKIFNIMGEDDSTDVQLLKAYIGYVALKIRLGESLFNIRNGIFNSNLDADLINRLNRILEDNDITKMIEDFTVKVKTHENILTKKEVGGGRPYNVPMRKSSKKPDVISGLVPIDIENSIPVVIDYLTKEYKSDDSPFEKLFNEAIAL